MPAQELFTTCKQPVNMATVACKLANTLEKLNRKLQALITGPIRLDVKIYQDILTKQANNVILR